MSATPAQVGELSVAQTAQLKDAIMVRLREIDTYADDSLTEYVMVLLGNRHGPAKIMSELEDFLSPMVVEQFVDWLFKRCQELRTSSVAPKPTASDQQVSTNLSGRQQRLFARALQDATGTRIKSDDREGVSTNERAPGRLQSREARFGHISRSRIRTPSPIHLRSRRKSRSPSPPSARRRHGRVERGATDRSRSPRPVYYKSISSRRESSRNYEPQAGRPRLVDRLGKVVDARELLSSSRTVSRGVFNVDDDLETRMSIGGERRLSASDLSSNENRLVRCSYWPHCKAGDTCEFAHPSEPCKHFPNCKFGDKCVHIHPVIPCKFQGRCQNPQCNYQHSSPAVTVGKSFSTANNPFHPPSAIPCRFFPNCKNTSCPFLHPTTTPCKFAENCLRPACPFFHPANRSLASKALVNAPCRYGKTCSKPDCPFQHSVSSSPQSISGSLASLSNGESAMADIQSIKPDRSVSIAL